MVCSLGVAASLFPNGLRPETLGIGITMAGFAIVECWGTTILARLAAFFLMFMAASTAPRIAPFAVVIAFGSGLRLLNSPRASSGSHSSPLLSLVATILVAGAATVLIFLAQIHFQVGEFWHTFHFHSQRAGGGRLRMLAGFLFCSDFMPVANWPVLLLLGHMIYYVWRLPDDGARRAGLTVLWGFPLVLLAGGLGAGALWYLTLGMFLLAASVLKNPQCRRGTLAAGMAGCLLFANVGTLVQVYGMLRGKIQKDFGSLREEALRLRSTPEHPLLIDHQVARYLFDYRLPEGSFDTAWAGDFSETYYLKGPRNGDVLAVGPDTINTLADFEHCVKHPPIWRILGMYNFQFESHPRRVFIFDAAGARGDWEN